MIYNVADYGIIHGKDVTSQLTALIAQAEDDSEIVLSQGDYYLSSENSVKTHRHITNTMAESEYERGEKFLITIAILIKNHKNLTISGNNARFILDGAATHIVVESCENITIKDITIEPKNPNLHRVVATKVSPFKAEFLIDNNSEYVVENGKIVFVGTDYRFPLFSHRMAWWHNSSFFDDPQKMFRHKHPLRYAFSAKETSSHRFVANGYFPKSIVKEGQEFYLFDTRRIQVGIFVDRSKGVTLDSVKQTFNYAFAYAAQDGEDLTVRNCEFAPKEGSSVQMTSLADFMHICMCRGKVLIDGCKFIGSGDDVLNVHGVYYTVIEAGDTLKVKYSHKQAYGFNPIRVGDTVAIVGRTTLKEKKRARVIASKMLDLYTIELTLDTRIQADCVDEVLEDVSAQPEVTFSGNTISRVSTRGILLTSGKKTVVKGNDFVYTKMPSIFVNGEAKYWYESGVISDLTIEGNRFMRTGESAIRVQPESVDIVHRNISVKNNTFCVNSHRPYFEFKHTANVVFCGNKYMYSSEKDKSTLMKTVGCEEIITDF